MILFTAYVKAGHLKAGGAPVLVPEGFSWAAFVFGPLWFAVKGAWVPFAGCLLAWVLLVVFLHGPVRAPLEGLLAFAAGLFGQDLRRWGLEWRGYHLASVIAARDADGAFARLLDEHPDLQVSALAWS